MHRRGVASEAQQTLMAERSKEFFSQISEQRKNSSATQFDRLAADLGMLPNDALSLNHAPAQAVNLAARKRYIAIEPQLRQLLSDQVGKSTAPLPPLSRTLNAYLVEIQPKLQEIQTYLLEQAPPQWEVAPARMSETDYLFPSLTNVANVQKLLLLNAIAHSEQNQHNEAAAALEASWQLNQAIAQRPELASQILFSITSDYQTRLLRHLSLTQPQLSLWQQRLAPPSPSASQHHSILKGIRFDAWLQYEALQKSLSKVAAQSHRWMIFSPVHRFQLANIDAAQTAHRAIDFLEKNNVCMRSQQSATAHLNTFQTAEWNDAVVPTPAVLTKRWKAQGDRNLSTELTQQILHAKQHYQTHQQWPQTQRVSSTECPSQQWLYDAQNGTLTIRLSTQTTPAPAHPHQALLTPNR